MLGGPAEREARGQVHVQQVSCLERRADADQHCSCKTDNTDRSRDELINGKVIVNQTGVGSKLVSS